VDPTDLAFAGAARQAELIRAGDVSPRELLDNAYARIARLDPQLNAFSALRREQAEAEADQAAARIRAGEERPLLGVPIAIKENLDLAGFVTTHGTAAYTKPAKADAELVRLLKAAGAIIVGRTHMPELAIWASTQSARWGATVNPWNARYSPGGSSGGSATAVAAGMVALAHASDGGGSIRAPAASTALFGLKPQRDRVPLGPDKEHWHGLSVYGCLSRSVIDTALFLDATARTDYVPLARRADPGRLRIAVSTKPAIHPTRVHQDQKDAVAETTKLLADLGHDVDERDPDYGSFPLQLMFGPRYFRGAYDDAAKADRPDLFERRTRGVVRVGRLTPMSQVRSVRRQADGFTERVLELWDDHDVLLMPVLPREPARLLEHEGLGTARMLFTNGEFVPSTVPWNITGQPAASVPAGWTADDVPRAVQIVGRPGAEATLIALAAQIEQARPWSGRIPACAR
jgi:amidase